MSNLTLTEHNFLNGNKKSHIDFAEDIMKMYYFKTLDDTEEILFYDGGVYKPRGKILINEECQKIIPECTSNKCREVMKAIQRSTYVTRKKFDQDPYLINVKNGIINIRTGKFVKHSPDILSRIQIPVIFDPKFGPIKFIKFLMDCLPDYKDRITVIEIFSSTLLRDFKLEKISMHVGEGENGKSTFLWVIDKLLGRNNTSHISIHDLIINRFARSGLDGKMANIYADISNKELKQLGVIKALVSGDYVDVEKKGKNAFTMRNQAKMVFSANELPDIDEFQYADLRRFIVTKWNQRFKSTVTKDDERKGIKKKNPNLQNELTTEEELSGILNLLIVTAKRLLKNGKFTYEQSVEQLQKEWKEKTDHFDSFFETRVNKDVNEEVTKSTLYEFYKKWCTENKIVSKSEREFNSRVKKIENVLDDRVKIKGKTTVVWKGIKLNQDNLVTQVTHTIT